MKPFTISSIQQIGVGTENFRKSWDWYIDKLGFDIKILEDDTVAQRMLPYTGGKSQKRHACIAINLQGGGGLEIWQYSERKPKRIEFNISIADLGIFMAKIRSNDIIAFRQELMDKGVQCSSVFKDLSGYGCFYLKDPFGNFFQVKENYNIYIRDRKKSGGIAGAFIGVSDMERSLKFYREVLGYDRTIYDVCGTFDDFSIMKGSEEKYRRVLLGKTDSPRGAFSGLLGTNEIELVQALDRMPRKIYEGRFWGDPGFIQICYDVSGMLELGAFCKSKGYPFTVDSCPEGEEFDMGDASGHFTYIEDPDGTLIEFVETHKIPLIAKLGLFIDINKRKKNKALPKILFKIMRIVSRVK